MRTRIFIFAIGVVVSMCDPGWALPPVTLPPPPAPQCSYVADESAGFDLQGESLLLTFAMLHATIPLPADWQDADLDSDGVPDWMQLGLLGAVLCAGDAATLEQFNTNRTRYLGLTSQLRAGFTNAVSVGAAMDTLGDHILTWLDTAQPELGGATPRATLQSSDVSQFEYVANGLIAEAAHFTVFVNQYQSYLSLLVTFAPIFAAWGGLDSEAYATLQHVMNVDILAGIRHTGEEVFQIRDFCLAAAETPIPPMTTALQAELTSVAGLSGSIATDMTSLYMPAFVIYGVAKSSTEPFSGAADYDGNGDTNKEVYDRVVNADGGSRSEFVAAVSGANPFYNGAPGLPAGGMMSLFILAGACVLAAARQQMGMRGR